MLADGTPATWRIVTRAGLPSVSARSRARERALSNPAFAKRMWKPGQSGNPKGAIGEWQRCRALCREHSELAAREIVRLITESDDDGVRYMAAQWTYEQAWDKAREFDPNAEKEPVSFDVDKLTDEQREQLRALLRVMGATRTAPDGDAGTR
jgi:hypothetical protein